MAKRPFVAEVERIYEPVRPNAELLGEIVDKYRKLCIQGKGGGGPCELHTVPDAEKGLQDAANGTGSQPKARAAG